MNIKFALVLLLSIMLPFSAWSMDRGISLSGHEAGERFPGVLDTDYQWPNLSHYDAMRSLNFNALRLPVRIEQIYRWDDPVWDDKSYYCELSDCPLDANEIDRLRDRIQAVTDRGETIVIDLREQGRIYSRFFGVDTSVDRLGQFWVALLDELELGDNAHLVLGIANEPQQPNASTWVNVANSAIRQIRANGYDYKIAIQGVSWSGAHSWGDDSNSNVNATYMKDIETYLGNIIFEVHQYFDANASGHARTCDAASIVRAHEGLEDVTTWLIDNKQKAILGETGIPNTQQCREALTEAIRIVESNPTVWEGWYLWTIGDYYRGPDPKNPDPDERLGYELFIDLDAHARGEATQISSLSTFLNSTGGTLCPPESDHDGDGWGWDGEKGCQVGVTVGGPEPIGDCPPESDHDGDGWGWDGEKGCQVGVTVGGPEPIGDCPPESDHDGDGWGWDGEKGCKITL